MRSTLQEFSDHRRRWEVEVDAVQALGEGLGAEEVTSVSGIVRRRDGSGSPAASHNPDRPQPVQRCGVPPEIRRLGRPSEDASSTGT